MHTAVLLIPHWIARTARPATARLATRHSLTIPILTRGNLNQPKTLPVALLQHPQPLRRVVVAGAVSNKTPLSKFLTKSLAVLDEARIAIKLKLVPKLSVRDVMFLTLAQLREQQERTRLRRMAASDNDQVTFWAFGEYIRSSSNPQSNALKCNSFHAIADCSSRIR